MKIDIYFNYLAQVQGKDNEKREVQKTKSVGKTELILSASGAGMVRDIKETQKDS